MKRILGTLFCIVLTIFCISSCGHNHKYSNGICTICNNEDPVYAEKYEEATRLLEFGNYNAAYDTFKELGNFKDSKAYLNRFKYVPTKIQYIDEWSGSGKKLTSQYNIDFFYNEHNLLCQYILTNPIGSKSIYVYTYDSKKNLKQEVTTFYDGDKVFGYYTYDQSGNLIQEISKWYDGVEYIYYYIYDESGLLIKSNFSDTSGSSSTTSFSYDSYNNLIKEVITADYGAKFIYDYSYDENGNLIKTIYTLPDGHTAIRDYTYDANGNLIKLIKTLNNGEKNIFDYSYDPNGNLIKEVYTPAQGIQLSANIEYMLVYIPNNLPEETEDLFDPTNYFFDLYR